jgi:hypothetical protein
VMDFAGTTGRRCTLGGRAQLLEDCAVPVPSLPSPARYDKGLDSRQFWVGWNAIWLGNVVERTGTSPTRCQLELPVGRF